MSNFQKIPSDPNDMQHLLRSMTLPVFEPDKLLVKFHDGCDPAPILFRLAMDKGVSSEKVEKCFVVTTQPGEVDEIRRTLNTHPETQRVERVFLKKI